MKHRSSRSGWAAAREVGYLRRADLTLERESTKSCRYNTFRECHGIYSTNDTDDSAGVLILGMCRCGLSRVSFLELYRGVTGSFFGIGILPVSDLLDFWYFGRYRSPPFCIPPPFPPPFFPKGGGVSQKGVHCPPFEEKGGHCPLFDTEMYRRIFLRYRYGKYREIPTEYEFIP